MIVIKCNDCGNILNQNDMVCNKCGCPVKDNFKRFCSTCGDEIKDGDIACNKCTNNNIDINNDEKLDYIIKTDRKRSLETFFKIVYIFSIIFWIIAFLLCIVMPFVWPILGVFAFIDFTILKLIKDNAVKSYMSLMDKEIYGEFYSILKINKINFPLNKVSSVRTIKLFRVINIVSIVADSGKAVRFFFVDNAEYFREEVIKQAKKICK